MSLDFRTIFLFIIGWVLFNKVISTIDLNAAELQYLADHLTGEECRKLVAAAHLKGYQEPNVLDQVERTVSKDVPCIDLLHHWNSQPGEGKGETHEILERRLRQIGKDALADWLGKTVFHEIGKDMNNSLEKGLKNFAKETTEQIFEGPTLAPIVENVDPTEWSPIDTVLYVIMVGLILVIFGLCCKICCGAFRKWRKKKQKRRVRFQKANNYNFIDETSDSESEDKFDVREYSDRVNLTSSEAES